MTDEFASRTPRDGDVPANVIEMEFPVPKTLILRKQLAAADTLEEARALVLSVILEAERGVCSFCCHVPTCGRPSHSS